MPDPTEEIQAAPRPTVDDASFRDSLLKLSGKIVTVVNPESLADAPVGRQLITGFYRAKIITVGSDFLSLGTEYQHRNGEKEPVRQFIPLSKIKRVSVMREERVIHL